MWELYVTQLSQEQITLVILGGNTELAGSFITDLSRFAPSFPISGCFALCCVSTMSDAVDVRSCARHSPVLSVHT